MRRTLGGLLAALLVVSGEAAAQSQGQLTAPLAPTRPPAKAAKAKAAKPPPSAPQPSAAERFQSPDHILRWIEGYRLDPEPKVVPDAVQAMSRLGVLRDPEKAGLFVGFIAGVLGANQAAARQLATAMFPMPPEDQGAIILGIVYSGLPDWKDLLTAMAERMPARKVLLNKHLFGKHQPLTKVPLESDPAILDTLWGYYLATGQHEPVIRMMVALPWAKERTDVNKTTIGGVAKWTLANYATRERDLLRLFREQMKAQPKPVAAELKEIVTAAESFEVHKIRKETVEAIDDVKRRNPGQSSTWAKTANIGSTAIALGCIVASALGQVAVGVPCVIGGALTSAAGKLLGDR